MTTVAELDALRQQALADPTREGAFLLALLDAILYVHLPRSDDSGKLHFLMFTRPDGLTVIPIFSAPEPAQAAAANAARVSALPGRELFAATRGATLMLDPNEVGMTLYPEEIAVLLDNQQAAPAPVAFECSEGVELFPASARDAWLLELIALALGPVDAVARVHLAAARAWGAGGEPDRLLAIVATPSRHAERVARAIAVALEGASRVPWLPVDLATYDPAEPLPADLAGSLERDWTRELRVPAPSRPD